MVNRHTLFGLGGWLSVAALTTVASTWAVSLIGADLAGRETRPVAQAEVERALAATPAAPAAQPPASLGPGAATRSFFYAEGSLTAACEQEKAVLQRWIPAQGYSTDGVERGPAPTVSVEFESDDRGVVVEVVCTRGTPEATVRPEGD
ncbi:hypothetical protein GCM10017673_31210 [Streptosporangium violaceochromogenes]|nr:hypothetical protein GCM10017673_31210 [Streptosporangium violaceochromogenes]